jgi:serine/threonine protein kinase
MDASTSSSCPPEQRLGAYLIGESTLDRSELSHIESCASCQRALDRLTESDFLAPYHSAAGDGFRALTFLSPPIRAGDTGSINEFAIEEVVDTGGMGTVLRGFDTKLGRSIALKVLMDQTSKSSYSRFEAEVRAVAKLSSNFIVPVYSVGRTLDHRPFMVMPFISGDSLAKRLRSGPISSRQSAEIVQQIASGLAVAHEAGLIHRDIKPANILMDINDGCAKIIDFGLVREHSKQGFTSTNVVCGTPEYMSCEQAQDPTRIDARSDVYSLGVLLYECLTGTTPFRGQPLDVLEQHRSTDPVPPSRLNRKIERDLETICLKAIAKEPSRRYATATEFAKDLASFQNGDPIAARPFSRTEKTLRWCHRNRALAIITLMLMASLIGGTVLSTCMWMLSRQHAAVAMESAKALQLSRNRLRESVQKFQSRVFSDESLHWQMSREFRIDMFRDVIEYLDEFASFADIDEFQTQTIAQSYLEVAQSALQVGQYEEAAIAARRGLDLSPATHQAPSVATLVSQANAAKLLYQSLHRHEPSETSQLEAVGAKCIAAIDAAWQLKPDDIGLIAARLSILFGLWEEGFDPVSNQQHLSRILQAKLELEKLISASTRPVESLVVLRRSLAQAYFLLVPIQSESDVAEHLRLFDANIISLKETFRALELPLLECNRLSGRYRYLIAKEHQKSDRVVDAIAALQSAVPEYQKAVNLQPQNRRWRLELVSLHVLMAECLESKKDLTLAKDSLNLAIVNLVQVIETDPRDVAARVAVIDLLIRFGELSLLVDDFRGAYRGFYTAAQDCRLLMNDEMQDWAMQTRIWALVKVNAALEGFDSKVEKQRTDEHFQNWIRVLRNDTHFGPRVAEAAISVIEKRTHFERPAWPTQVRTLDP